jgi:PAS domain S-box-containing protein/putative nucleotidyltransferase with HDIG domain
MARPLAVLIVEDVESDAQLIVRMLTKAGYTVTFERVDSAAQIRRALEKQPWEIVISDFSMPGLDGFAALKVFQETGLDIPFIVVSGTMGEETAVAMMKAGAHDYVMKGNLARLAPAVERELKHAETKRETRRAEEELRSREQRYQTLLKTSLDGFWLVDMQGGLLEVNETYCRMSGYTEQELLSMHIPDLEDKEVPSDTASHIQKIIEQGEDRFESRHRRKDGSIFEVEINVQYRAAEGGRFVAFLQDISERKRAEQARRESNELFSLFMKNSPIYCFIKAVTPSESRNLNVSDNFQDMLGIPASDMVGKTMAELFPADLAAKMTADDWAVISNNIVLRLDEEFNGRSYTSIKFPIIQGRRTLLAGYTIDITERKRAEAEIQNLARFPSENPGPILRIALDGTLLYANPSGLSLLPKWHLQAGQAAPPMLREAALQAINSETTQMLDLEYGERVYSFYVAPIVAAGYANLYGHDITERQQAEEELRVKDWAIESSLNAIAISDLAGNLNYVNPAFLKLWGYSSQAEVLGKSSLGFWQMGEKAAEVVKVLQSQGGWFGELIAQGRDGTDFEVHVAASMVKGVDGQPVCMMASFSDITERKQVERKLEEERILLRTLIDNLPDRIYAMDVQGRKTLSNIADWQASGGKTMEDVIGKSDMDTYPPDLAKEYWALDKAVIDTGTPVLNREEPGLDAQGNSVWVLSSKVPLRDSQGKIIGIVGIGHDITERRTYFDKLQKTVEGTVNTIALIVEARDPYTAGHQKRVAVISVAVAKELGLPEEQIQGIYFASLIHDLGKIQVPSEILSKPGKLTRLEFDMIKTHSKVGYELLKEIEFPWPIAEIVYQHHERVNGSGYPRKLKGNRISIEAKIIGMADVIEAISSHRPYRPALGLDVALDEINKNKGILYDPEIVETFIKVIEKDKTLISST